MNCAQHFDLITSRSIFTWTWYDPVWNDYLNKGVPMLPTLPIEKARTPLGEFIEKLAPGEEVVVTRDGEPVAVIRAAPPRATTPRRLGTLKGSIISIAADFDDIPEGFEEYLP